MGEILVVEEQNPAFKIGDVVKLNSGGPSMTIIEIRNKENIICKWIGDDRRYRQESFSPQTIKLVDGKDVSACASTVYDSDALIRMAIEYITVSDIGALEKNQQIIDLVSSIEGVRATSKNSKE